MARTKVLAQVAVMAVIVASILYVPLGFALALVLRVAGFAFEASATFGGAFNMFLGLAVWWLLFFAGSLVYALCFYPWDDKVLGWPKKN